MSPVKLHELRRPSRMPQLFQEMSSFQDQYGCIIVELYVLPIVLCFSAISDVSLDEKALRALT